MSLLRLQNKHVTKALFEGNERLIRPQRHAIWVTKHPDLINPHVKAMMNIADFRHLLSFTDILINHHLVTVLVEKWRSETHTFHFPLEETMITLENVALELDLPIDGKVSGVGLWLPIPAQCRTSGKCGIMKYHQVVVVE